MQQNVRYYIVKAEDQPVVRSMPASRASGFGPDQARQQAHEAAKPSVGSVLRLALRRRREGAVRT